MRGGDAAVRFTELAMKEIISLTDGARLGTLGDADLVFDEQNGRIETILVPPKARLQRTHPPTRVPWTAIRRVGPEVVIIDLADTHPDRRPS
jgi:YlmC/YmxH family sporulation protein